MANAQGDSCDPKSISSMWDLLMKEDKLNSPFVMDCELQVKELMHQVDVMVYQKQLAWYREHLQQMQNFQKLQKENQVHKDSLEDKDKKVSHLRGQIESMEQSRKDMAAEYERQLNVLRGEVAGMRKDYERLQRKYAKHKDKETGDSTMETSRLNEQLQSYQKRITDYESMRFAMVEEIKALQAEKKALSDKSGFLQDQNSSYQSQLERRREMQDSTQSSLKQQVTDLEDQLKRSKEANSSQAAQLGRLKSSLDDAITAQRQILDDKEATEKSLGESKQTVRALEEVMSKLKEDLQQKSYSFAEIKEDRDSLKLKVQHLSDSVKARDHNIQQMSESSRQELSTKVQQLMGEIELLRSSLRKHKSNEKNLMEETNVLQEQLDASRHENVELAKHLQAKKSELKKLQSEEVKKLHNEITKLKEAASEAAVIYERKLEGTRKEISDLTAEIHQKSVAMATVSENQARAERQVRDLQEALERRDAEMHVANAQLEALRLENRQLRKTALESKSSHGETGSDTDRTLRDLQQTYADAIGTLERQNERLQGEVQKAKNQVQQAETNTQEQIRTALRQSEDTVRRVQQEERSRTDQAKQSCERRIQEIQQHLKETSSDYEVQTKRLRAELAAQEEKTNAYKQQLQKIRQENAAMSSFVQGIDTIVMQPGGRHSKRKYFNSNYNNASLHQDSCPHSLEVNGFLSGNEEEEVHHADVAAANFLASQEQKTKELERKLDQNMQSFQQHANTILAKYLTPT